MITSNENINYLDDSDFLSSDDEIGYFTSEEESFNKTPLIDSIINNDLNQFNILLNENL